MVTGPCEYALKNWLLYFKMWIISLKECLFLSLEGLPQSRYSLNKAVHLRHGRQKDFFPALITNILTFIFCPKRNSSGLPWWPSGEESACQCRRHGYYPWSGKTICPHAAGQLSPWASTTEPELCSLGATNTEPIEPRSSAPQHEKPPTMRSHS